MTSVGINKRADILIIVSEFFEKFILHRMDWPDLQRLSLNQLTQATWQRQIQNWLAEKNQRSLVLMATGQKTATPITPLQQIERIHSQLPCPKYCHIRPRQSSK